MHLKKTTNLTSMAKLTTCLRKTRGMRSMKNKTMNKSILYQIWLSTHSNWEWAQLVILMIQRKPCLIQAMTAKFKYKLDSTGYPKLKSIIWGDKHTNYQRCLVIVNLTVSVNQQNITQTLSSTALSHQQKGLSRCYTLKFKKLTLITNARIAGLSLNKLL